MTIIKTVTVTLEQFPKSVNRFSDKNCGENKRQEPSEKQSESKTTLGSRSYDILIGGGLIEQAGIEIAQRFPKARVAIVTDTNIAALHLEKLQQSLVQAGIAATVIIVPAGEKSKSFATLEGVVDQLLTAKLERGDLCIALGGGVIGDLTGFAAAITRRGMGFIQIPTSLLAQVDSSVGGKTGINSRHGKNLIGAFYQPALVIADTDILNTLSRREFCAGYAEMVKYGLINQPDFFEWLERDWQQVFAGGSARGEAIARACRFKAEIVARDERESGERALLNLGHTFGHAFEAATGYDSTRLVHGEGVAIGMVLAYEFSTRLGLCHDNSAARLVAHLQAVGLPTSLAQIPGGVGDVDDLMSHIAQDKKVNRGCLNFILVRGLGQAFIARNIAANEVRSFLDQKLNQA